MKKTLEFLDKQHELNMKTIKKQIKTLKKNEQTNLIIKKLLKMENQTIYNIFHSIFNGFNNDKEAIHTLLTLEYLTNIGIYAEKKETHASKAMRELFQTKPYYEFVFNIQGKGERQTQKKLLKIINEYEKKEIKKLEILYKRGGVNRENLKYFKSKLKTFDKKNINLLPKKVKNFIMKS